MIFERTVRTRRQWDKYCLWVALIGGNLAGIMFVLPDLSMALGGPAWPHLMKQLYSLPLIYSVAALGHAPLRRLFWMLVPLSLWLSWSMMGHVVARNWPGLTHDLERNVTGAVIYFLGSSFIALTQGKLGRGLEEENTAAEPVAQFDATEDVWPPPPRRAE